MFVVPYNLPPSLCMKYEFMFFCLIVPGLDKRGKEENENVERREEENENVEHGEVEMRKMRMRVKRGITRLN
jgi:hypothetical protein